MKLQELEKLAVTIPDAATLVDVGRSTGYALAASGEWPTIRVGRLKRVPVVGLRAWVKRRMRPGGQARAEASQTPRDQPANG